MKRFDYKKFLPKAVTILLCLFFFGGVIWGANNILEMEGTMKPYIAAKSASPLPETPEEIAAYLNAAIKKALDEKPQLSSSEDCETDDATIKAEGASPALLAAADYIKDNLDKHIGDSFAALSSDYGKGLAGIITMLDIQTSDIVSAECRDIYYKCPICGDEEDEAPDVCPECGGTEAFLERHRDTYSITVKLADGSASFAKNFAVRSGEEIKKLADSGCAEFFDCGQPKVVYKNAEIRAEVNRLTDKIIKLEFVKDADVMSGLRFTGGYTYLGSLPVSFTLSDKIKYSFSWPGLELSESSVSVEPGNTVALKAALTCDDPTAYTVRWSSTDERYATVDEDGYVKAKKKTGVVYIIAEFDFQGQTYSDTCEVIVKTSVESIDISKRKLSLSVGDSYKIKSSVSPNKATIKTVNWYSEDEKIAAVSAEGVVTAVGAGQTTVYAVSDDGYYKASCKVEVTVE